MSKAKQRQLEFIYIDNMAPLCKCGCGCHVTWNYSNYWNTYLKGHDKRKYKTWLHDNNAPLCACGCGNPVIRVKHPPFNWNTYIHNHHRATESFVEKRWIDPPLCACGCGQKTSLKFRGRGWRKYVSVEHQLNDPNYHDLLSKRTERFWQDPDLRRRMSRNKRINQSPNNLEKAFDEATSSCIKYVGNGLLWFSFLSGKNKNPDFFIINETKVIELWGTYWHKGEKPEELIEQYNKIGMECLVIWEHDWHSNKKNILKEVSNFIT